MRLNWILPGRRIAADLDEARLEIEWVPGIPVAVLFGQQCPPSPDDAAEREWLLDAARLAAAELLRDRLSRSALFYNLHQSRVNSLSMFHFTIRPDLGDGVQKLELYVYARDTDVARFARDLTTIDLVYAAVRGRLLADGAAVDIGRITAHLHAFYYVIPGAVACL